MKIVNFLTLLLVILNSIGIIYIKYLDHKTNKKINDIDNAVFEHMKDDYNSKLENKE